MPWNASRMLAFGKCSYVTRTASLFLYRLEGNALALLHEPALAFERVFTGVHSLLLQIFYL